MGWAGEGTAVEPTCAKNKLRPHQLKKQKKIVLYQLSLFGQIVIVNGKWVCNMVHSKVHRMQNKAQLNI